MDLNGYIHNDGRFDFRWKSIGCLEVIPSYSSFWVNVKVCNDSFVVIITGLVMKLLEFSLLMISAPKKIMISIFRSSFSKM